MEGRDPVENILMALTEANQRPIFEASLSLARRRGAVLWLFHFHEGAMIGQPNQSGPDPGAAPADWVVGLVEKARKAGVDARPLFAQGPGRQAILSALQDSGADLVVLGRTSRTMLNDAVAGVAGFIMYNAPPRAHILFVSLDESAADIPAE